MHFFTIIKENSQRIKNKNFQIIYKLPLWEWTINRLSKNNEKIYINTDSEEILKKTISMPNVVVIKRSEKHISWENNSKKLGSPVESMYKEFCEEYIKNKNDKVCLFHVTSPFINIETIFKASLFLDNGYDSVQSVKKIQDFIFFKDNKENIKPINYDMNVVQRTQDLEPVFMSLGAFFISRAKDVIKTGRRLPGNCYNYQLNALESIEIDDLDQLNLTRIIARGLN